MKRRRTITKVLCLLIAGAAVNVAVAWGCGLAATGLTQKVRRLTQPELEKMKESGWIPFPYKHPFRVAVDLLEVSGTGVSYVARLETDEDIPGVEWFGSHNSYLHLIDIHVVAGWPRPALTGETYAQEMFTTPTLGRSHYFGRLKNGVPFASRGGPRLSAGGTNRWMWSIPDWYLARSPGQCVALPCKPYFPGFAINTVFYAGVLWVMFAAPFTLRWMIRRRRGQCAQCAYPIGQNERCTECGAAVTLKS